MMTLLGDTVFYLLLTLASTRWLALAVSDGQADVGRTVLKYSYVSRLPWERPYSPRRLLSRFGLRSTQLLFDLPLVRLSGSCHVEVEAPEGTEVRHASIDRQTLGQPWTELDQVRGKLARAHLQARQAVFTENVVYRLTVGLGAQRRGLLRASLAASLLAVFALLIVALFHKRISQQSTSTAGTLLLIIPGLIASYILRPSEHPMASRLLLGIRLLMGTIAFATFTAAAMISLKVKEVTLNRGAYVLLAIAGVSFLLVAGANGAASSRPRLRPRRHPPRE